MKNFRDPTDAEVRKDFPGGWADDVQNKFSQSGRTQQENDAYNFVKTLAKFRLHSSALQTGKFMQYLPVDGMYIYFRYDDNQTVMCVVNTSDKEQAVNFSNYAERTTGFSSAVNVFDNTSSATTASVNIRAHGCLVLDLKK